MNSAIPLEIRRSDITIEAKSEGIIMERQVSRLFLVVLITFEASAIRYIIKKINIAEKIR